MSNEPNKPIPAQELTEKELEGIVGGVTNLKIDEKMKVEIPMAGEDGALKEAYKGFRA